MHDNNEGPETQEYMPDILEYPHDTDIAEVTLNCCPITMNPIHAGESMRCRVYDAATREKKYEMTALAYGPILFDQCEVLEVHRSFRTHRELMPREIHWLAIESGEIQYRMRQTQEHGVEFVTMRIPRTLAMNYAATRIACYSCGSYTGHEAFEDKMDGLVDLGFVHPEDLEEMTPTAKGQPSFSKGQDLQSDLKAAMKSTLCARFVTAPHNAASEVSASDRETIVYIDAASGRVLLVREVSAGVIISNRLFEWQVLETS